MIRFDNNNNDKVEMEHHLFKQTKYIEIHLQVSKLVLVTAVKARGNLLFFRHHSSQDPSR